MKQKAHWNFPPIGLALEMLLQLFPVKFCKIWDCNVLWQAQYLMRLGLMRVSRRIINDVSDVSRVNHAIHLAWQTQSIWWGARMMPATLRIGNDGSLVVTIFLSGRREIQSSWRLILAPPCSVNDVSYVGRINHDTHVERQTQYDDACFSAHWK